MGRPILIGRNLYLDDSAAQINFPVISALLCDIAELFDRLSNIRHGRNVYVFQVPATGPHCQWLGNDIGIFLCAKGNDWNAWVYEFAHEYCHNLISGKLDGDFSNLKWFEETICEVASIVALQKLPTLPIWNRILSPEYSELYRQYMNMLMLSNSSLKAHIEANRGIRVLIEHVVGNHPGSSAEKQRGAYRAIAFRMLPFFLRNDKLWRIIGQIGDTTLSLSLEELFARLEKEASEDYYHDLVDLRKSLLP